MFSIDRFSIEYIVNDASNPANTILNIIIGISPIFIGNVSLFPISLNIPIGIVVIDMYVISAYQLCSTMSKFILSIIDRKSVV